MKAALVLAAVLAASPALAATIPGTLAVIGIDHQVYLQDPNGGEPQGLTGGADPGRMAAGEPILRRVQSEAPGDERMRFSNPTWSPDATLLLVHGTRMTGEIAGASGVYRLDPKRPGVVTPVHEDPRRGPIYTFWDPTGRRAAVLLNDRDGVSLGVVDVEAGGWSAVGTGLPFYFAWRADGKRLVAHVGGSARENPGAEVRLVDLARPDEDGFASRRVSDRPAAFRAPSWDAKGRFVYAAWPKGDGGPALHLVESDGTTRDLGPVASRSAFSWSADGRTLALGEGVLPSGGLYAGLALVNVSDGRREALYAGAVGGFFGSPDGRRILVIAPDLDTGEWRAVVVSRETREARETLRFLPSPEAQQLMLHFDQYALSHRLWSPDSSHFVLAGYPADAGRDGPARPTVWVVNAASGAVTVVAEARSAFWSPR